MIRAVLDTNVIVSSFLSPAGIPAEIRQAWREGEFLVCLSRELFDEIAEVLDRPVIRRAATVTTEEVSRFLQLLAETSVWCRGPLQVEPVIATDPDDDVVLATALGAEADVVVTGDRDLLAIEEYRGIGILSPRRFVEALRESRK